MKTYHAGNPTAVFARTDAEAESYIEAFGNLNNARWIANYRHTDGLLERMDVLLVPGWQKCPENVATLRTMESYGYLAHCIVLKMTTSVDDVMQSLTEAG